MQISEFLFFFLKTPCIPFFRNDRLNSYYIRKQSIPIRIFYCAVVLTVFYSVTLIIRKSQCEEPISHDILFKEMFHKGFHVYATIQPIFHTTIHICVRSTDIQMQHCSLFNVQAIRAAIVWMPPFVSTFRQLLVTGSETLRIASSPYIDC